MRVKYLCVASWSGKEETEKCLQNMDIELLSRACLAHVYCSMLQHVAVCFGVLQCATVSDKMLVPCTCLCSCALQWVAVRASMLQGVAVCCSMLVFVMLKLLVMTLEHTKLPAKLLDYFLRSNKRNINQLIALP